MFSHVFYVQGLPDLKQDTEVTIRIPANAGQSVPVELELPTDLLVDANQAARIRATQTAGPTTAPQTISSLPPTFQQPGTTRMVSPSSMSAGLRSLSMQTTPSRAGSINPPISSPQALMLGSGSPELLSQSASPIQSVSAQTGISPLRRDRTLNTGEQFLPSIGVSPSGSGQFSPRNQSLPSREPSVKAGLPFVIPAGSVTPTFQSTTAAVPAPSTIQSMRPSAILASAPASSSQPLTGQQLADEFASASSISSNASVVLRTPSASVTSSIPGTSPTPIPVSVGNSPSRLTRASPSRAASSLSARSPMIPSASPVSQQTSVQQAPSLSVARSPSTISQVLLSQGMSGSSMASEPPLTSDREEEEADEEEPVAGTTEEEPESEAPSVTGRDLFAREAQRMMATAGVQIDDAEKQQAIEEAWTELDSDQKAGWEADAAQVGSSNPTPSIMGCELPQAGSPTRRTPVRSTAGASAAPAESSQPTEEEEQESPPPVEPPKPSCNIALLLMKYATPNPE